MLRFYTFIAINKIIKVDLAVVGDVTNVIKSTIKTLKKKNLNLEESNKQKIHLISKIVMKQ